MSQTKEGYLAKCNAALNDRLDGLRDALASVRGAKRSERENERQAAVRVMNEVAAMPFDETNPAITERRCRLLEQAVWELEEER